MCEQYSLRLYFPHKKINENFNSLLAVKLGTTDKHWFQIWIQHYKYVIYEENCLLKYAIKVNKRELTWKRLQTCTLEC